MSGETLDNALQSGASGKGSRGDAAASFCDPHLPGTAVAPRNGAGNSHSWKNIRKNTPLERGNFTWEGTSCPAAAPAFSAPGKDLKA